MGFFSAEPPLGSGYVPFGAAAVVLGTNDAGKTSLLRLVRDELNPGARKTPQGPGELTRSTAFFVDASATEMRFVIGRLLADRIRTPPSTGDPRVSEVVGATLAARAGVIESDLDGWPFGGWDHHKLGDLALDDSTPEELLGGLRVALRIRSRTWFWMSSKARVSSPSNQSTIRDTDGSRACTGAYRR